MRESDQTDRWRLYSITAGYNYLHPDANLAQGQQYCPPEDTGFHDFAYGFYAFPQGTGDPRIPGTAVFLSRTVTGVPSVMRLHVERNGSLHNNVLLLTILIDDVPYVASKNRLTLLQKASGLWCCSAHYGFMEHPNIPQLLSGAEFERCQMNFKKMTYYIGHESLMLKKTKQRFPCLAAENFQNHATQQRSRYRLLLSAQ